MTRKQIVVVEVTPLHRRGPMAGASSMLAAALLVVVVSAGALAAFSASAPAEHVGGIALFSLLGLAASVVAWLSAAILRREAALFQREVEAAKAEAARIEAAGGDAARGEAANADAARGGAARGGAARGEEPVRGEVIEAIEVEDNRLVLAQVALYLRERSSLAAEREMLAMEREQLSRLVAQERQIRKSLWEMLRRR